MSIPPPPVRSPPQSPTFPALQPRGLRQDDTLVGDDSSTTNLQTSLEGPSSQTPSPAHSVFSIEELDISLLSNNGSSQSPLQTFRSSISTNLDRFWRRNRGVVLVVLAQIFMVGMNTAATTIQKPGEHGSEGWHPLQVHSPGPLPFPVKHHHPQSNDIH